MSRQDEPFAGSWYDKGGYLAAKHEQVYGDRRVDRNLAHTGRAPAAGRLRFILARLRRTR